MIDLTELKSTLDTFKNMTVEEVEDYMKNTKPNEVPPLFILFCGLLVGSGVTYDELLKKLSTGDITEADAQRAHEFGISPNEVED